MFTRKVNAPPARTEAPVTREVRPHYEIGQPIKLEQVQKGMIIMIAKNRIIPAGLADGEWSHSTMRKEVTSVYRGLDREGPDGKQITILNYKSNQRGNDPIYHEDIDKHFTLQINFLGWAD